MRGNALSLGSERTHAIGAHVIERGLFRKIVGSQYNGPAGLGLLFEELT